MQEARHRDNQRWAHNVSQMHSMRSKAPDKIKNMMYVKIHRSAHTEIIAACDKNLIGRKIKEDALEIFVSEDFYKGDLMEKKEVVALLKTSSNTNLVGEVAFLCGLEAGIITIFSVIIIGGTKHAQFYSIS